jgi:hypothetical protein
VPLTLETPLVSGRQRTFSAKQGNEAEMGPKRGVIVLKREIFFRSAIFDCNQWSGWMFDQR